MNTDKARTIAFEQATEVGPAGDFSRKRTQRTQRGIAHALTRMGDAVNQSGGTPRVLVNVGVYESPNTCFHSRRP